MPIAATPHITGPDRVPVRLAAGREIVSGGKSLARALILLDLACTWAWPAGQVQAAGDAAAGLPPTQVFSPAEGGQNCALAQHKRGLIYVGNGDDGVLDLQWVAGRTPGAGSPSERGEPDFIADNHRQACEVASPSVRAS